MDSYYNGGMSMPRRFPTAQQHIHSRLRFPDIPERCLIIPIAKVNQHIGGVIMGFPPQS